jgi:hypothetical protein
MTVSCLFELFFAVVFLSCFCVVFLHVDLITKYKETKKLNQELEKKLELVDRNYQLNIKTFTRHNDETVTKQKKRIHELVWKLIEKDDAAREKISILNGKLDDRGRVIANLTEDQLRRSDHNERVVQALMSICKVNVELEHVIHYKCPSQPCDICYEENKEYVFRVCCGVNVLCTNCCEKYTQCLVCKKDIYDIELASKSKDIEKLQNDIASRTYDRYKFVSYRWLN